MKEENVARAMNRRNATGALATLLVLTIIGVFVFRLGPMAPLVIPANTMVHEDGDRFVAPLRMSWILSTVVPYDSMFDFAASRSVLKEDGVDLSLAHADHQSIADHGHGRYSHWGHPLGQRVYFSSSDGTDPTLNGREYTLELSAAPPIWLFVVALGAMVVLLFRDLDQSRLLPWISLAFVVLMSAAWIIVFWGSVLIFPDSATYISFHPWVPLGYPVFVASVSAIFGYVGLPPVQIVCLTSSFLFLSYSTGILAKSRLVFSATAVLLAVYSPLMTYGGYILSEATYTALLCVFVGTGLLLVNRFRRSLAVALGGSAALAWSIRPSGTFLILVVAYVAILLLPRVGARAILAWLIVPAVAAFSLVFAVHEVVRGPGLPSQAGRLLFGQVAFLFDPKQVASENREVATQIAAALEPHAAGFAAQVGWKARHTFSTDDYSQRVVDVDRALAIDASRDFRANEALLMNLAKDTILQNPGAYLRWVAEDIAWAWSTKVLYLIRSAPENDLASYAEQSERRTAIVKKFSLTLSEDEIQADPSAVANAYGEFIDLWRRALALIATFPGLAPLLGVGLLVAAVLAPFCPSQTIKGLGIIGITVHMSVAMTSAVTLFIGRYALPTDPLVIAAAVLALHGGWHSMRKRRRPAIPRSAGAPAFADPLP